MTLVEWVLVIMLIPHGATGMKHEYIYGTMQLESREACGDKAEEIYKKWRAEAPEGTPFTMRLICIEKSDPRVDL